MEPSPTYQPYFDQLTSFASAEERKADLVAAKAEFFNLTGEVFEDDKVFEMRMVSFLEYYLFDRPSPSSRKTPAQEFYELRLQASEPEEAAAYRGFLETIHGLFEVRKLGKQQVRLRELFSGKDHDVTERRQLAGMEKGDILEARLIPYAGQKLFSSAFCYHPREVAKTILKEVKRRKKKEPLRLAKEMAWECAKMALKVERYRQIAIEKIYDFENRVL